MALDVSLKGTTSGTGVEVNTSNQVKVVLQADTTTLPENIGSIRIFSENDTGDILGAPELFSPEVDQDYRIRVSQDTMLDTENFSYSLQNTGKHNTTLTTFASTWTVGAFNTNPTAIVTASSLALMRTYAVFPVIGTSTLAFDVEGSFTLTPGANAIIEFGGFLPSATAATSPIDGVFIRVNSAGVQGIVAYNGVETSTGVFETAYASGVPWAYTPTQKYQFIVYVTTRVCQFWINDGTSTTLYGSVNTPNGQGQPVASYALPFALRHYHNGTAGNGNSFALSSYSVRLGGAGYNSIIGSNTNCMNNGGYCLQAGAGVMTNPSLQFGTVTTGTVVNPTPAVCTNTTAAVATGLGGSAWETANLAVATDGILFSYQVPALPTATGATYVPQKRLRINGVSFSSHIQTGLTGGPLCTKFQLAWGHTAVSLQTAEAATTKTARRITLPQTQVVTATQAASTLVAQTVYDFKLLNPIYVNPGEFIQLVKTNTGTAATAGTIVTNLVYDYCWE